MKKLSSTNFVERKELCTLFNHFKDGSIVGLQADPEHFDPDPAVQIDADRTFHFDPDPTFIKFNADQDTWRCRLKNKSKDWKMTTTKNCLGNQFLGKERILYLLFET